VALVERGGNVRAHQTLSRIERVLFRGREWHRGPRQFKKLKPRKQRQPKPDNQPRLPFA
jgi:hypothetical protein